jgi:TolA-binding protein
VTLDDSALIALARELPVELPSRAQREEVRTAVLATRARSVIRGSHRRMRVSMLLVGTLASAAGVALALGFPSAPAAAPRTTELHAEPHVTIQVNVPHASIATLPSPPAPLPSPPPAPAPLRRIVAVPPPPPVEPPPSPELPRESIEPAPAELAYDTAWSALRSGELARAALGFARALELAPDGPLADDAAYWHAVALARAHRRGEAIAAFRTMIDGARSVHAGAASAMLGWLLLDDNASRVEAGQRFHAAADDPDPEVRASSRAGLAAIAHGDE